MRIMLIAEEAAGMQVLRMLVNSGHEIVVTLATAGRATEQDATVWTLAQKLGVPTAPSVDVTNADFADALAHQGIDVILNVHALHVICKEVLAVPRWGAFNLHPGPLPHYAGLNAPSWALYYGEPSHAVTLHKMEAGIDTGAIVAQASFPIDDTDTAITVYSKCVGHGVPLIAKLIDTLSSDPQSLPLTEQELSQRRYFGRTVPNQGQLSWHQPAQAIVNFVRACDFGPFASPWGHPECTLANLRVRIVSAARTGKTALAVPGTIVGCYDNGIDVATADERVRVSQVEINGKRYAAPEVLSAGARVTSN